MENIEWARAQAMAADSPDGLTALAQGFWHKMNRRDK